MRTCCLYIVGDYICKQQVLDLQNGIVQIVILIITILNDLIKSDYPLNRVEYMEGGR